MGSYNSGVELKEGKGRGGGGNKSSLNSHCFRGRYRVVVKTAVSREEPSGLQIQAPWIILKSIRYGSIWMEFKTGKISLVKNQNSF